MALKRHFVALDGCRGIAAIMVAISHSTQWAGAPAPPFAFLSLDFFFMLSGFVIALAYEDRLRGPMSAMAFLRIRVLRLHPTLIFGALLGTVGAVAKMLHHHVPVQIADIVLLVGMSILLIPFPGHLARDIDRYDQAFPLNGPTWSMFAEYSVNLAYALIANVLGRTILLSIIIASAIGVAAISFEMGTLSFGFGQSDIGFSLVRVCYPFFTGVALCRLYRAGVFSRRTVPLATPCLLLIVIIGMPGFVPTIGYALFAVFALLPVVMVAGIATDPERERRSRIMAALGRLSYPLYVIHAPIILALIPLGKHLPDSARLAFALALVAISVIVAWVVERCYDRPVRDYFRRKGTRP